MTMTIKELSNALANIKNDYELDDDTPVELSVDACVLIEEVYYDEDHNIIIIE